MLILFIVLRAIRRSCWVEQRDDSTGSGMLRTWHMPLDRKCDGLSGCQNFSHDAFEKGGLANRGANPGIGHEASKFGIREPASHIRVRQKISIPGAFQAPA